MRCSGTEFLSRNSLLLLAVPPERLGNLVVEETTFGFDHQGVRMDMGDVCARQWSVVGADTVKVFVEGNTPNPHAPAVEYIAASQLATLKTFDLARFAPCLQLECRTRFLEACDSTYEYTIKFESPAPGGVVRAVVVKVQVQWVWGSAALRKHMHLSEDTLLEGVLVVFNNILLPVLHKSESMRGHSDGGKQRGANIVAVATLTVEEEDDLPCVVELTKETLTEGCTTALFKFLEKEDKEKEKAKIKNRERSFDHDILKPMLSISKPDSGNTGRHLINARTKRNQDILGRAKVDASIQGIAPQSYWDCLNDKVFLHQGGLDEETEEDGGATPPQGPPEPGLEGMDLDRPLTTTGRHSSRQVKRKFEVEKKGAEEHDDCPPSAIKPIIKRPAISKLLSRVQTLEKQLDDAKRDLAESRKETKRVQHLADKLQKQLDSRM